jgi:hypothetical protein
MKKQIIKARIINIVHEEDRTLLYVEPHYYVIVGTDTTANIGDELYLPEGWQILNLK